MSPECVWNGKEMNTWDLIKRQLETKLSPDTFQNWVSKTEFSHIHDQTLCVAVPNEATRDWMDAEYGGLVKSMLRDMGLGLSSVVYELNAPAVNGNGKHAEAVLREDTLDAPRTQLNPKFTFDNFVVGSCNQFAHAAAHAVAKNPSKRYNPLFIYSGVGMGKTHLMHAIGRELMGSYAGMRIIYTSSERFMNEMITCIRLEKMARFHQFYRSADVLLVDDIHVLGGKERTQEEFFHTFNELYDHQKQIVISSDSTPKEIPGLVERLRSRFEWGLMVDMTAPDLETKMAILDKKAESEGVKLPEDVRIFMATKTKSNVRELEGGLVKLIAY
jgi:chromosomal replication initiator protein